jgi:hypothetical protein
MMSGMDDRNDPNDDITLEAMRGLSRIFAKVEEDNIRNILINISLRIRPCFEKDKPKVRAAAIELFGNLSRFGDGPSREPFLEQVRVGKRGEKRGWPGRAGSAASAWLTPTSVSPLPQQIHSNLISFLLHLNEGEKDVIEAVKGTLKKLAPLIEAPSLSQYVCGYSMALELR